MSDAAMTEQEDEAFRRDVTHTIIHILIQGRAHVQVLTDSMDTDDTSAEDQARASLNELLDGLNAGQLRNVLTVALPLLDLELLREAMHIYCEGDSDD